MHRQVPGLNLAALNRNAPSQQQVAANNETKRVNGQRGFLLDFFEKFHEAHEELSSITTFTRQEFFKESYMIEALAVGLPNNFLSAANQDYQQLSARSGRSSNATATIEQQTMHQELAMLSNLKAYFKEHQIDVTDIISAIKQEKRVASQMDLDGDDKHLSKSYWQLTTLIFTAFYLDHSQNEYLSTYFSQRLQQNVQRLKICLEIVQGLLTKSELMEQEDEEDEWGQNESGNLSMELGGSKDMEDILNADTSNWDPFRDAHKFEALAAAEQRVRKEQVQAQFDLLREQENEEQERIKNAEKQEDLEASIHIAETKLSQREAIIRQKDADQARLLEDAERLQAELEEKTEEISRLSQQMVDQEMAMHKEQLAMREMHTMIVRLQDKAAQNQELKMELEAKDRQLIELGQERNRLADEARVSRLSMHNLGEDIGGQLSGRAFQESSPARRRREKQEQKRKEREAVEKGGAPEIEMTKMKAGEYGQLNQDEFQETPYKHDFEDYEQDLQKELGGQTVDGTFVMGDMGMAGEEYFETNPNDTSYEMGGNDNTNRDLMTEDVCEVPLDMRSPDVTQIIDQEKENFALATKDIIGDKLNTSSGSHKKLSKEDGNLLQTQVQLQKVQAELSEYRVRCSKQKERIEHIERLNREHESLYTEFLVRSIKAERDKRQLERRLARINYIIAFFSRFQCSKPCLRSWMDPQQFTWQRGVKIGVVFVFVLLIIILIAI